MNDGHFMFELPSRLAAEHVLTGQWTWKKMKLELEWWKPTIGYWPAEVRRDWVWIRLLGLPMNLWSQKVLKEIGNLCGGHIETEEETSLKNHLHWARIKVQGNGERIPREVEITCDDFTYTIPVWCEAPVTVKFSEKRREEKGKYLTVNTQDQLLQITKEVITAKKVDRHVGSSSEGSLMQVGPRFKRGEYNVYSRQKLGQRKVGPILLDPITGEKARAQPLQISSEDIFNIEIAANQTKENKAQSQITPWNRDDGELEVARHMVDMPGKNKEELGRKVQR
uniref:Putative ovule protein n=1 Tax=Solanum chacoense TaxID=4108 RepID=A0A0V0I8I5_SOLCH